MNLFFAKEKTSLRPSNRPKKNEGELDGGAVNCESFAAGVTVNADAPGGGKRSVLLLQSTFPKVQSDAAS